MSTETTAPIFAITLPGMENTLADEARDLGFYVQGVTPGGVFISGGWPEVWRANLELRGATRVLWRIGSFMAFHLAQLDKRARKFPWADVLRPGCAGTGGGRNVPQIKDLSRGCGNQEDRDGAG